MHVHVCVLKCGHVLLREKGWRKKRGGALKRGTARKRGRGRGRGGVRHRGRERYGKGKIKKETGTKSILLSSKHLGGVIGRGGVKHLHGHIDI